MKRTCTDEDIKWVRSMSEQRMQTPQLGTNSYERAKSDIEASLQLGIEAEQDQVGQAWLITAFSEEQVRWIAAWLAGEGFHRGEQNCAAYLY